MISTTDLYVPLANRRVRLEPLTAVHREPLRAACARDHEIWDIYSTCMIGAPFDAEFDGKLAGKGPQHAYAVLDGDALVGCTSWYGVEPGNRALAIGYTYLAPEVRGGDFNLALKGLMIGHAWRIGFARIHFDVDVRNRRSCAAVLKLGCRQDGVLRQNKITWTGHVRDTAIFSLLPGEESDALKPWL